jgi:hypothetical protein
MKGSRKKRQRKQDRTEERPSQRAADDPSRAPEEEGSATQINSNRQLVNEHRTDESGAPDDDR